MSAKEEHHLVPTKLYLFIFFALVTMTAATVGASYMELGRAGNILLGLSIAICKAALVVLFFMHMKWDAANDISIRAFAIFPIMLFIIMVCCIMPDVGAKLGDARPLPIEDRMNVPYPLPKH